MKEKDGINFIMREETANTTGLDINLPPFLLKLIEETRVKEAMSGGDKISEDEVEVFYSSQLEEQEEMLKN